jgi:hypothetical protein
MAMNPIESQMLEILKQGKERCGFVAVKAEFEAEGTRVDELLRLIEISRRAGLNIGLKIGGCEAVRDLIESKLFGVEYIIAPMVETSYALSKFIAAKNKVFPQEERENISFLFNIETDTAMKNREELLDTACNFQDGSDGVVFGRVDYSMSKNYSRNDINGDKVTDDVMAVAAMCRDAGKEFVIGGGVSIEAIDTLKRIRDVHLNRFETRKIIFDANILDEKSATDGLLMAVQFELLWLKNKRLSYKFIYEEDEARIEMLDARWQELILEQGVPGARR